LISGIASQLDTLFKTMWNLDRQTLTSPNLASHHSKALLSFGLRRVNVTIV
jgi:hypothetical protein